MVDDAEEPTAQVKNVQEVANGTWRGFMSVIADRRPGAAQPPTIIDQGALPVPDLRSILGSRAVLVVPSRRTLGRLRAALGIVRPRVPGVCPCGRPARPAEARGPVPTRCAWCAGGRSASCGSDEHPPLSDEPGSISIH